MKKKKNKSKPEYDCSGFQIPSFEACSYNGSIGLICCQHPMTTLIDGQCPKCNAESRQYIPPEIKEQMKRDKELREKHGQELLVSINDRSPVRKMAPGWSQMILRQATINLN